MSEANSLARTAQVRATPPAADPDGRGSAASRQTLTGRYDSKDAYLRRAVALAATVAVQAGSASPFAHVSLASVAAAAGVNRSTLYRMWPSQQEFWDDLQAFLIDADHPAGPLGQPMAPDPASDEALYDALQDVLLHDRSSLVELGIIGQPGDAAARAPVARRRSARLRALTHELRNDLDRHGVQCSDGVGLKDLAIALTMLGTGVPVTGRLVRRALLTFDAATYAPPPGAGRSLLGSLQSAIRAALTKPAAAAAPVRTVVPVPTVASAPSGQIGRRQDYLRIAAQLATEPDSDGPGVDRALHYLTLDSLARSVGVTRRTLGNVWPTQASFRLDLLAFMLRSEREEVVHAVRDARRRVITGEQPDATAAFLDLGDAIHTALLQRRADLSFVAFAPHLDDIEVSNRARSEHNQSLTLVRHALDLLLQDLELRPRPGVTSEHLAVALLVVCDGASRLVRTDPALVGPGLLAGPTRRSITAVSIASVIDHFVEPVDTRPQVSRYLRLVS